METVTLVQTLNKAVCISGSSNTLEVGIHPSIFPQGK